MYSVSLYSVDPQTDSIIDDTAGPADNAAQADAASAPGIAEPFEAGTR